MTENKLRQVIKALLKEKSSYSEKPWLLSKILIAAPNEDGGAFEIDKPIKITSQRYKGILDRMLNMNIPDPEADEAISTTFRDSTEESELPQPNTPEEFEKVFGKTSSDSEFRQEYWRDWRDKDLQKQRDADEEEANKKSQGTTVAGIKESRNIKITVSQLRQLVKEVSKRRPDGYLPSTAKNLYLDREFKSVGGWPEGEYNPPVNVRISNYLKSLGLLDVD